MVPSSAGRDADDDAPHSGVRSVRALLRGVSFAFQHQRMRRHALRLATFFIAALPVSLNAQQERLGTISFPTSGSAAAQPHFVRGVLLLHSFQYGEAAQAFRQAQAIEPRFALAYWGEALTYTHQVWNQQDLTAARAVLARLGRDSAARAMAAPTARERAYLAAAEALYGAGGKAQRDTLYADAMSRLAHDYPDDDEAQVLYATALFGLTQGVRDVPTYMRAGAIAQAVFRRNPQHPGAAHMIIHAFDDPVHAPLGLYAARAYSQIAPAAAHAQHMTTHIFLALGMWPDVVSQNVIAAGPDTARWQAGHSTHWLLYAYLQQGRIAAARALVASLAAHAGDRADMRGPLGNFRARLVIDGAQWNSPEATALAASAGAAGEDDYEYATFAAGYAAARRGDGAAAREWLARLQRANGTAVGTVRAGAPGVASVPVILELTLRAELLRQGGKSDSAIALLTHATALEEAMPAEFGPVASLLPSHESLGALYASLGRDADAAAAYARALQLQPGRSSALLGLARAEAKRGRGEEARRVWLQLAENWRDADADVPALPEVRAAARATPTTR